MERRCKINGQAVEAQGKAGKLQKAEGQRKGAGAVVWTGSGSARQSAKSIGLGCVGFWWVYLRRRKGRGLWRRVTAAGRSAVSGQQSAADADGR